MLSWPPCLPGPSPPANRLTIWGCCGMRLSTGGRAPDFTCSTRLGVSCIARQRIGGKGRCPDQAKQQNLRQNTSFHRQPHCLPRRPAVVAAGFAEQSSLQGINRHSQTPPETAQILAFCRVPVKQWVACADFPALLPRPPSKTTSDPSQRAVLIPAHQPRARKAANRAETIGETISAVAPGRAGISRSDGWAEAALGSQWKALARVAIANVEFLGSTPCRTPRLDR